MAKISIVFGLLLIGLGIIGYVGDGSTAVPADAESGAADTATAETSDDAPAKKQSITALIPAIFGVLLVLFGVMAFKESMLKHAMHGAAAVGLLGFLAGAGRGGMGLGKFFSGDPSLNQRSFLFVWLMAIICLVFVVLCIRSFIAARKAKVEEKPA